MAQGGAPVLNGNGKTLAVAIEAVRGEIAELKRQLDVTRRAPLPQADQRALVESFVIELMRRGRPSVAVVGDKLRLQFRGDMLAPEDVLALIALPLQ
jgi:hypothetical protein